MVCCGIKANRELSVPVGLDHSVTLLADITGLHEAKPRKKSHVLPERFISEDPTSKHSVETVYVRGSDCFLSVLANLRSAFDIKSEVDVAQAMSWGLGHYAF